MNEKKQVERREEQAAVDAQTIYVPNVDIIEDGQSLRLRQYGGLQYAKVGDGEEHRIVAAAPNVFVALDRKLKVRIDRHSDGTVTGELVMMVPPQRVADGSVQLERVAALPIAAR